MKKKAVIISLLLCLGLYSAVFAQIVPDKREIKLEVKPGQELTGSIIVKNVSDKRILVKAYFEDFVFLPPYDGRKAPRPLGSNSRSCGQWIAVSPGEILFAGKGEKEVFYKINVPKDAQGGYYAVLFLEQGAGELEGEKGIALVVRTGCSFLLETENKVKKAKVEEVFVKQDKIKCEIVNSGNVILVSEPAVYILGQEGDMIDRIETKKMFLPPEEKMELELPIKNKIPKGKHTLVMNFDFGGGSVLVKEVDFTKSSSGSLKITGVRD